MATRLERSEYPVAVAAPHPEPFHLDMPVIAGAMAATQLNHPFCLGRIAVGEQQQFHPVGRWRCQGEIHPP